MNDYGFQGRKRGRPVKRDATYYQDIWEMYQSLAAWFVGKHERAHRSIRELLETYFINLFMEHGLRVMRVNSPEFKGRLRTLENNISFAKKHHSGSHNNPAFVVKDKSLKLVSIKGKSFLIRDLGDAGYEIHPAPETVEI